VGIKNKIGIMEKNKYLLTMMAARRAEQLLPWGKTPDKK